MKTTKMLTILVLALSLILCLSGISKAEISLTVNDQPVDSIDLETGQTCTIKIVSNDNSTYEAWVGFDYGRTSWTFVHTQTMPAAGGDAYVELLDEPAYYRYYVSTIPLGQPTPPYTAPGAHFVFEYEAGEVGEFYLNLYSDTYDSVTIRVTEGLPTPQPLETVFTYQGRLIDANEVANGLYDFEFKLFHDPCDTRTQVGGTIALNDVEVLDGYFTVELDFNDANAFNGDARWLEIGVRVGELEDPNVYTLLSPRQEVTAAPYTLYAKTAENVFGGIVGGGTSNYVPKFLSSNSIGNSVIYESGGGNVGIGTTGPAAKLEVAGQVKITGGSPGSGKVLASDSGGLATWQTLAETDPTVLASVKDGVSWGEVSGIPAGFADGIDDVGAGDNLGNHTATQNLKLNGYWLSGDGGSEGVYVANDGSVSIGTTSPAAKLDVNGDISAASNYKIGGNTVLSIAGAYNTFLGSGAGQGNTGTANTFSGYRAGYFNTAGYSNTFSGNLAGYNNTTGYGNTFSGNLAGGTNNTGSYNTFLGYEAGYSNSTGSRNVFLGYRAGWAVADSNKLCIANSNVGPPLIYGDFSAGTVGIGTTSPAAKLDVSGDISAASVYKIGGNTVLSVPGTGNTLVGLLAGAVNTGNYNTFSGSQAGTSNTAGTANTFSGSQAGTSNTAGTANTFSGFQAGFSNTTGNGNVFLGYQAGYNETGSNKLIIANSDVNTLIYGDFLNKKIGIGTTTIYVGQAINTWTGAYLTTGGLWINNSSRDAKENITSVDNREVLDKLSKVPVSTWNYKVEDKSVRHIGPMAQDLYAAFGFGDSDKSIATIDGDGISFAAIKGLYQIVKEKDAEIAAIKQENEDIKKRLTDMESQLSRLSLQQEGGIK